MKYRRVGSFIPDYDALPDAHKELFKQAVQEINRAAARHTGAGIPVFPQALRVKPMSGYPDIYEMTWHYRRPDGRATFRFVIINGELAIEWRRIGYHAIYENP